jgi:hypothetical protein
MTEVELSKLQVGEIFFCMIEWDGSELCLPKSASLDPATRFRASGYSCAASLANRFNVSKRVNILSASDLVRRRVGISD